MSRQATALGSVADLDTVVDADSHVVGEPFEEILPYTDEKYRGAREIIEAAQDVKTEIFSITRGGPIHPFEGDEEEHGLYSSQTSASILAEKEDQMTEFDIDHSVLNPTLLGAINSVTNPRYAVAIADAYNDWVLAELVDRSDRLKASIVVAPQKPDAAAEEIDRLADEDGMVAVQLPPTGLVPPAGHEKYDPIYQAAEDHGLPVTLHSHGSMTHNAFPIQSKYNLGWAEDHAVRHPFILMWHLSTMLLRGIPERFPDLEFALSEAGIAWVPYMLWRLDDHYLEHSQEAPLLERLPSEYFRERFHVTTQPVGHVADDPRNVARMVRMIGPESVLFSADMPHHDFDTPEELFDLVNPDLDPDEVAAVMGETAADLFDLG